MELSTPEKNVKLNWETVRNFYNGHTNTSLITLNKFSAYVLADSEATYANFQTYCEKMLKEEKHKKSILWLQSKYLKLGIATAIGLSLFTFWMHYKNIPTNFEDHFNGKQLSDLQEWQIADLDSNYIDLDRGLLKLHTLPGAYWIDTRQGEKPIIKNFLFRKINCEECQIDITIRHFQPNMMAQQVGVFLLDRKKNSFDRQSYVRYTYAYGGYNNVEENEKHWEVVQIVEQLREDAIPSAVEIPIRYNVDGTRRIFLYHYLMLRIVITKENYRFYWAASDSHPNKLIYTLPRIVEPEYLGIGAFQGFTDDRGIPFDADVIPAYIDEISVSPIK
ncbi:MAG: hypothetical protein AAFP82_07015 [Bacteroidota bacterium]